MLVLSRKKGEGITIFCPDGTIIKIATVDIDRGKTRVGITAPGEYKIYRDELLKDDGSIAEDEKQQ